jgi:predicted metal-dependent phosphoesterase TrpH
MNSLKQFGPSLVDKQKLAALDAKMRAFIGRCMIEGETAKTLAPSFLAAGCDLLETATGNHEKAVMAFKGMLFAFEHAHKKKPQ